MGSQVRRQARDMANRILDVLRVVAVDDPRAAELIRGFSKTDWRIRQATVTMLRNQNMTDWYEVLATYVTEKA
jgi:hypothetical protein